MHKSQNLFPRKVDSQEKKSEENKIKMRFFEWAVLKVCASAVKLSCRNEAIKF